MIVLDTDVLSNLFNGRPDVVSAVSLVPDNELAVTVVTCEEVLRGWLAKIRQASNGEGRMTLAIAYSRFGDALIALPKFILLPYTTVADTLYKSWRVAKVKCGGTRDLRIASICVAHNASLITYNRRDFDKVPELKLSVWN